MQLPENGRRQDLQRLPLRKKLNEKTQQGTRSDKPKVLSSPAFEAYYRDQQILPDEEFETFLECLRKPLPSVFRITEASRFIHTVQKRVEDLRIELRNVQGDSSSEPMLENVAWYPGGLAYKLNASRNLIRNDERLARLHKFLVSQHRLGTINRQEEVSMVPVSLLDICPGHHVLDVCASPGSKTAQIMDLIDRGDISQAATRPESLIVANDADLKRCWMLIHQLKKYGCSELVITNHDGQNFPDLIKFDRILCDVPCSGDGTLRKMPDIWRRWTPESGFPLHRLQVAITWRAVQLLVPGGTMVYSTCSFNPLENEAVVCEIIRKAKGKLRVVDVSNRLEKLKRRPGLSTWKVKDCSPAGTWFDSFEDVPPKRRKKVTESMFPPRDESILQNVRRCIRLYPQDQNSGGFFVALLEKVGEVDAASESETSATPASMEIEDDTKATPRSGRRSNQDVLYGGGKLIANDPLLRLAEKQDKDTENAIAESYGLDHDFVRTGLLFRASEARKVYFANSKVLGLIDMSLKKNSTVTGRTVRVVYGGVRVMEYSPRDGATTEHRLTSEGIHLLFYRMRKQKVVLSEDDYKLLLRNRTLQFNSFNSPEANKQVELCTPGSIAFQMEGANKREIIVSLKGAEKLTPLVQAELLVSLKGALGLPLEVEEELESSVASMEVTELE